nr:MAG TPA: hypothetical protein [Caudoviricetes sp.]
MYSFSFCANRGFCAINMPINNKYFLISILY